MIPAPVSEFWFMDMENTPAPAPDHAYSQVKADIIRGVFHPGEKLLMAMLTMRYGIGVGPLREVLSRLVSERLVVAINQKGYRVAPMSVAEMVDIYDARANLEGLILALAIERGDDAWEAQIIAASHTLSKVVELSTPEEMLSIWDARHRAFHNAIASGCGSKNLLQARAYLLDQAERYRHIWLKRTVFSDHALGAKREEHAELVSAILARNKSKATQLITQHLMTPVPVIRQILTEEPRLASAFKR